MRKEFQINAPELFKEKVLDWLEPFDTFCFLDSHGYIDPYGQWDWIAAAGVNASYSTGQREEVITQLSKLDQAIATGQKWWFGHLSFGLQANFLKVDNAKEDTIQFPLFSFFSPRWLIYCKGDSLHIEAPDPEALFAQFNRSLLVPRQGKSPRLYLQKRVSRSSYLATIAKLKEHIQQGDCYEINYCQEFFAEGASVDPLFLYQQLMKISPTPFSALYRQGPRWVLSASPERFICKRENKLISQPIKGTARRDLSDTSVDQLIREQLRSSEKERAENVMIVDLVRNDLSRVCTPGSVVVDELFGVYSFPQVHQLISTISGNLLSSISFSKILEATFPMGSMTGAPKKRVLELTSQYEQSARGLYSGSIGYIDPQGNFDFNVVIRTLLYHQAKKYLSFHVGGGITTNSQPEKEWEECLVKASGLLKLFEQESNS